MISLLLQRDDYTSKGIFGKLYVEETEFLCYTLEHAYLYSGEYLPKVPKGIYTCKRGIHQLKSGGPFETFEVTKVPGRWGILFHVGNYNEDSSGCILVGVDRTSRDFLTGSRTAFMSFMVRLKNVDSFLLTIE